MTPTEKTHKPGSPWPFLICLACVAILLVGGLIALRPRPQQPKAQPALAEAVMPDGTLLRLEQVTFGKSHQFVDQNAASDGWGFNVRAPRQIAQHHTHQDRLVVWMTRQDLAGRALDFEWWSHNVAVVDGDQEIWDDNAGRNIQGAHSSSMSGSRPFNRDHNAGQAKLIVVHSELPPFRSQANTFALRVFDAGQRQVASFNLPVPAGMGPYPVWKPDPLPNAQQDGGVTATLVEIKTSSAKGMQDGVERESLQLNPVLKIEVEGKLDKEWQRREWDLVDAIGNYGNIFDCRLSLHEPAWKLKLRLFRDKNAEHSPEAIYKAPEFAPPKADVGARWPGEVKLGRVSLALKNFGGSGTVTYVDAGGGNTGTSSSSGGGGGCSYHVQSEGRGGARRVVVKANWPHVRWRAEGTDLDTRLVASVTDDQDKALPEASVQVEEDQFWFFNPPAGCKTIRVTFIVQQAKKFEYVIDPSQLPVPK